MSHAAALWITHRLGIIGAPRRCWGLTRRQLISLDVHRPTNVQIMYHSGQYLFFTSFSTECVVTRKERAHHDEQHED